MRPNIEEFKKISDILSGNITSLAKYFGVSRRTVHVWTKNEEFKTIVEDGRGALFDECVHTARVIALGVPRINEKGLLIGWIEKPDTKMLQFLISHLGKSEGFGKSIDTTTNEKDISFAKFLTKEQIKVFKIN